VGFNKMARLAIVLLLGASNTSAQADGGWLELPAYWAPVLVQGTESGTRMDIIGPLNLDVARAGTGRGASRADMPSIVYYWVVETDHHFFLGYALYHAMGRSRAPEQGDMRAHDMQGVLLAVEKAENRPMGRLVALGTWGGEAPMFYRELYDHETSDELRAVWQGNVRFDAAADDAAGDIDFVIDGLGVHPVIYVESGFHRVFGEKEQARFPEGPDVFEDLSFVDWRGVPTLEESSSQQRKARMRNPGQAELSGGPGRGVPADDGLLYRYEGASQMVITGKSRGRGTMFHHWNLIAYDLEPVSELWSRRLDYESGDDSLFRAYGVFAGASEPGLSSRAPWGWSAMFFDPAAWFAPVPTVAGDTREHAVTGASFDTPDVLLSRDHGRADPPR